MNCCLRAGLLSLLARVAECFNRVVHFNRVLCMVFVGRDVFNDCSLSDNQLKYKRFFDCAVVPPLIREPTAICI